jgi:hypothetical protein
VVDDISWLYECKYLPNFQTVCLKVTDLSITSDVSFLKEMQVKDKVFPAFLSPLFSLSLADSFPLRIRLQTLRLFVIRAFWLT